MAGTAPSAPFAHPTNPWLLRALPLKLSTGAEAPEILRDDRFQRIGCDAEPFERQAGGFRRLGTLFSTVGDKAIIDGFFVNGSARLIGAISALLRKVQSGYVYHYAFTMIIGVFALLTWWVIPR